MADELTMDIKANDKASDVIKEVDGNVDKLTDGVDKADRETKKATDSSKKYTGALGGLNTQTVIAGASIGGMVAVLSRGIGIYEEIESAARRYNFTMTSAGASSSQMADAQRQMNKTFSETGTSIEEQQQALSMLTLKIGDPEIALERLSDAMDLAAATGEGVVDVAKDIGEAATGDINGLEQLGVLIEEDTDRLREIDDAGRRSAEAFAILQEKVGGASQALDENVVKVKQLKTGWRETQAALGNYTLEVGNFLATAATLGQAGDDTTTALGGVADYLNDSAEGIGVLAEAADVLFGGEWSKRREMQSAAAQDRVEDYKRLSGMTEEQIQLQKEFTWSVERYGLESIEAKEAAEAYSRALGDLGGEFEETNKKFAGSARDQRKQGIEQLAGYFEGMDTEAVLERVKKEEQEQAAVRAQKNRLARKELEILSATDPVQRVLLERELELLDIKGQSLTAEERKTAAVRAELEAVDKLLEMRLDRELGELTEKHDKRAEAIKRETAAMLDNLDTQKRMEALSRANASVSTDQLDADSLDPVRSGQVEGDLERYAQSREETRIQRAMLEDAAATAGESMGKVSGLLGEDASARSQEMREGLEALRKEMEMRVELGQMSQDQADAFLEKQRAKVESIERENRALQQQMKMYGELSNGLGSLGVNITNLAQNWGDFEKAADAGAAALSTVSAVGGATAGILGETAQQQAGIQAGFEYAAAAGALGLALTTQNPAFYAAAGQHTLAGGLYTAVASGAVGASGGKGSVSSAGGGGGGSRGGSPMAGIDLSRERELNAQAYADALESQREAREMHVTVSYNAIPIGESPSTQRVVADAMAMNNSSVIERGRN